MFVTAEAACFKGTLAAKNICKFIVQRCCFVTDISIEFKSLDMNVAEWLCAFCECCLGAV